MTYIVLALSLAVTPVGPVPQPVDRCLGAPLQLSWADLLVPSQMAERVSGPGCAERSADATLRMLHRTVKPLTVGRLKLGSFRFAGEKIGFGIDMMWGPETAFHGSHRGYGDREEIRVVPQLYLPQKWQEAIDTATYPALFVGGAAVATLIIIEAIKAETRK